MTVNGSLRTAKRGLSMLIALLMLLGMFGMVGSTAKADGAGYYLVGTMNGWAVNETYQLTENPGQTGEYWITLDLAAGAEFKIVYSKDGSKLSSTQSQPGRNVPARSSCPRSNPVSSTATVT